MARPHSSSHTSSRLVSVKPAIERYSRPVRGAWSFLVVLGGIVGWSLLAIGIIYLVAACEALPGFLGPTPGDTSPRTGLGIVALVLGLAALGGAFIAARRASP
jgi:hypothetical protein